MERTCSRTEADYQRIEALDKYHEEMLDEREYRGIDQSTARPNNTEYPRTHPPNRGVPKGPSLAPPWTCRAQLPITPFSPRYT